MNETDLAPAFTEYGSLVMESIGSAMRRDLSSVPSLEFTPLKILGLECLKNNTECLGDCPDAAYFGPNIKTDSDEVG